MSKKRFREGEEQGEKNSKIKIAKKLLKENVSLDIIINATGLTETEVKELKYKT